MKMAMTAGQLAAMQMVFGYGVCFFMGLTCATILWLIWTGKIDLSSLLSETNGDASMSRFQLLIFTFVVAVCLFLLTVQNGQFPFISTGILTLLGISASTYAAGKAISYSRDEGVTTSDERSDMRQTAQAISNTGAATMVDSAGTASSGSEVPVAPPVPVAPVP